MKHALVLNSEEQLHRVSCPSPGARAFSARATTHSLTRIVHRELQRTAKTHPFGKFHSRRGGALRRGRRPPSIPNSVNISATARGISHGDCAFGLACRSRQSRSMHCAAFRAADDSSLAEEQASSICFGSPRSAGFEIPLSDPCPGATAQTGNRLEADVQICRVFIAASGRWERSTATLPGVRRSAGGWRSAFPSRQSGDSSRLPGSHRQGRFLPSTAAKSRDVPPKRGQTASTGRLAWLRVSSGCLLPFAPGGGMFLSPPEAFPRKSRSSQLLLDFPLS